MLPVQLVGCHNRKYDRYARRSRFTGDTVRQWKNWQRGTVTLLQNLLGLAKMEPCSPDPALLSAAAASWALPGRASAALRESHPVLDEGSFCATEQALALVENLTAEDTVLFLLSGVKGGRCSAWEATAPTAPPTPPVGMPTGTR